MKDAVVLVFANKQDQRDGKLQQRPVSRFVHHYDLIYLLVLRCLAMKPDQLQDRLGLHTLKERTWYIQPCSATKGKHTTWSLSPSKVLTVTMATVCFRRRVV